MFLCQGQIKKQGKATDGTSSLRVTLPWDQRLAFAGKASDYIQTARHSTRNVSMCNRVCEWRSGLITTLVIEFTPSASLVALRHRDVRVAVRSPCCTVSGDSFNPSTVNSFNLNFHPLEAVSR